jgi:hypothetical protein
VWRAQPLADASEVEVEAVLTLMRQVVNTLERHYFKTEGTSFDYDSLNDAEALIRQLQVARMVQDERDARLKAGDYREEDFKRPPEI